mgnify:CR=1 FL=1
MPFSGSWEWFLLEHAEGFRFWVLSRTLPDGFHLEPFGVLPPGQRLEPLKVLGRTFLAKRVATAAYTEAEAAHR